MEYSIQNGVPPFLCILPTLGLYHCAKPVWAANDARVDETSNNNNKDYLYRPRYKLWRSLTRSHFDGPWLPQGMTLSTGLIDI